MAFFAADGGSNSGSEEGAAEEMNGVFSGPFVGEAFDFIVGDEVDLGQGWPPTFLECLPALASRF